ncbi:MAG: sugar phosphate isomerase/epimerase family protein [Candidatus Hodarchaeota archaeon]
MKLGISTLGHVIDLALKGNFKDLKELQFKASVECLNFAEQSGIEFVELVIDLPEVFDNENRQEFIKNVNSYSLKKQIHGPYVDLSLCSYNNHIREASIESCKETAKICYQIDVETMTIHPGYANFMLGSIREINKEQLKRSIHTLLDSINHNKLKICLENMPQDAYIMTDTNNIEEIFKVINRNDLFITYDTSHFYTCDGDLRLLWAKFHSIIKNVHIVDNFTKISDTHPTLGTGKIDFKEIIDVMKNYNYNGPLIIELSSVKSLNQSINFINKFL